MTIAEDAPNAFRRFLRRLPEKLVDSGIVKVLFPTGVLPPSLVGAFKAVCEPRLPELETPAPDSRPVAFVWPYRSGKSVLCCSSAGAGTSRMGSASASGDWPSTSAVGSTSSGIGPSAGAGPSTSGGGPSTLVVGSTAPAVAPSAVAVGSSDDAAADYWSWYDADVVVISSDDDD